MNVIEAQGLSKTYRLAGKEAAEFCALSGLSFQIREGESVGIIGRNGAGKSTLLKLLAGITLPSSGHAKVLGRFAALLEVGTGFHPDLSGRDNIYLNASILGLSRKDVHKELTRIISFAGIGRFIDQPLRTYSTGMKLRLAFSVIAHMQTDIIALDEVLTVGDSMFQVKCIERIFEFKNEGRTVLFVSHNLSAVKKLCDRCIVLDQGRMVFDGPTDKAIGHYLRAMQPTECDPPAPISHVHVQCDVKQATLELELSGIAEYEELDLGVNLCTEDGTTLYHFSNRFIGKTLATTTGRLHLTLCFQHQLKPGSYPISVYLGQSEQEILWAEHLVRLVVPPFAPYGFHNPEAIQGPMITAFELAAR